MAVFIFCVAAYLAGSVNFSILASKLAGKGDVRRSFSGNPGAVNIYRLLGWRWGVSVLALDIGRGFAVALLVQHLFMSPWAIVLGCLALLIGNLAPVFHGFKGGKGVATAMGIYLSMSPQAALMAGAIWIVVVYAGGRASVGSLVATLIYPLLLFVLNAPGYQIAFGAFLFLVIAWAHRKNILRLWRGQEAILRK